MKGHLKRKWTVLLLALVMTLLSGAGVFGASYPDLSGHWSEGTMMKAAELGSKATTTTPCARINR